MKFIVKPYSAIIGYVQTSATFIATINLHLLPLLLHLFLRVLLHCEFYMIIKDSLETKSVGNMLKEERHRMGLSIEEVSNQIKIKPQYIEALEQGNYDRFDSPVYIKGFLKNYSKFLGLDTDRILALYRRGESNKQITTSRIHNAGEIYKNFVGSRRSVYLISAVLGLLFVGIYLFTQFSVVIRPPLLTISSPLEATGSDLGNTYSYTTTADRLIISGGTSPNSLVIINGMIVPTNNFNEFTLDEIPLPNKENGIRITSTNQFGRESVINIKVSRIIPEEGVKEIKAEILAESNTTIQVFRDSLPAIDRSTNKGEVFSTTANKELIIIIVDPNTIEVNINGNMYNVKSGSNSWQLQNGAISYTYDN